MGFLLDLLQDLSEKGILKENGEELGQQKKWAGGALFQAQGSMGFKTDEKIKLWTRQVPQMWEELERTGVYHVRREYIEQKNDTMAPYYLRLYRWYTQRARKYIEVPEGLEYPIWLSTDEEYRLQPTAYSVILRLEVPREQVLFINMNAWGYRENYWYIPADEADAKTHQEERKKYGVASDDELFLTDKGNFYPLLKRKVENSWDRVFTLKPGEGQEIAATAWELKREWVEEVQIYGEMH